MGLFSKKENIKKEYATKLTKPKASFFEKIKKLLSKHKTASNEYYQELEDLLISNDVGASLSIKIVDETKKYCLKNNIDDASKIIDCLLDIMRNIYNNEEYDSSLNVSSKPSIIFVFGVNGVGKTTSIAKLANSFKKISKKVLLVAADTFRAGAVEQLDVWAKRIDCDILVGKENSDPSSVVFDGIKKTKDEGYDICIVDTAGRLQSKTNLMNEANKMYRVVEKIIENPSVESLLVLDSTMGQNGVFQAKAFLEACKITGIVLTKLDGTSKGGIILSIKDNLNIPVKFIGIGEGIDDLKEFDLDVYLNTLVGRE